jgi:hypothetical protein
VYDRSENVAMDPCLDHGASASLSPVHRAQTGRQLHVQATRLAVAATASRCLRAHARPVGRARG